jgi:hypothetical protein
VGTPSLAFVRMLTNGVEDDEQRSPFTQLNARVERLAAGHVTAGFVPLHRFNV